MAKRHDIANLPNSTLQVNLQVTGQLEHESMTENMFQKLSSAESDSEEKSECVDVVGHQRRGHGWAPRVKQTVKDTVCWAEKKNLSNTAETVPMEGKEVGSEANLTNDGKLAPERQGRTQESQVGLARGSERNVCVRAPSDCDACSFF